MTDNNFEVMEDRSQQIAKQLSNWRKCRRPKDYKTLEKKTDDYFRICSELQILPSLETYSLAVGVNRSTVWRWAHGQGCSEEWSLLIQQAIQTIEAYLDLAATQEPRNAVYVIWRQKSMFGKSDLPGRSEAENTFRAVSTEREYTLPHDLLLKYSDDEEEPLTTQITQSQSIPESIPEPIQYGTLHEDWMSVPDDEWSNVPDFGFH